MDHYRRRSRDLQVADARQAAAAARETVSEVAQNVRKTHTTLSELHAFGPPRPSSARLLVPLRRTW